MTDVEKQIAKVTPYEPTQDMIHAVKRFDPALPLEHIRAIWWAMWGAAAHPAPAAPSDPRTKGMPSFPEQASKEVNDACWTFIKAMPHQLPGPIFNDLKPALYATLKSFAAAAQPPAAAESPAAPVQPPAVPASISERWNIERDGDALKVCFNDHEKGDGCRYERFVPENTAASAPVQPVGELPKHHVPIALLGAPHHFTKAAWAYAEEYARTALSTRPELSDADLKRIGTIYSRSVLSGNGPDYAGMRAAIDAALAAARGGA